MSEIRHVINGELVRYARGTTTTTPPPTTPPTTETTGLGLSPLGSFPLGGK